MSYTLKITKDTPQSLSIVNMLKVLAKDYDFLQIRENTTRVQGSNSWL